MPKNTDPIVVEQTFNAPIAVVWKAITDKDQMRQWFFEPMTDFRPEVGFETQFDVQCEGQSYQHQWKVTEVVPERRIEYDWRYGGYPGDSSVMWELSETLDGTKLKLTHKGHETFPQGNRIFSRESGVTGWTYFVQESLKAFLECNLTMP
ncbi:MAG: SRPBCC domain-containing protein [Ignavibacteria bacterium]|nr:SRPBCC domain-containing protein [Ignavibacteria bacterium]